MNKVKPTALQQRAMEIIKENPDMPLGKAMITAGYAEKTASHPKQNLIATPGVLNAREQWIEILSKKGITVDKLAEKQKEWLDAKKVNNSLTEPDKLVPDYQTQLKAGEMLREDFGFKQQASASVTLNFNQKADKQREEYGI